MKTFQTITKSYFALKNDTTAAIIAALNSTNQTSISLEDDENADFLLINGKGDAIINRIVNAHKTDKGDWLLDFDNIKDVAISDLNLPNCIDLLATIDYFTNN